MSSMLSSVAPSALNALMSSCALPAATYGALRVLVRSSSYLHLHDPHSAKEDGGKHDSSSSRTPWSTSAPELRELARQAGGFQGARPFTLSCRGSSLLLNHANVMASPPMSYCKLRFHSVTPRSASQDLTTRSVALAGLQAQQQQQHAACAVLELPTQEAEGALSKWFSKTQPRIKGFSRKLALRQVNRRIIARVARRFTIGIPVLGFYFVSKLMVRDLARVKLEYAQGETGVSALFATALAADVLDLAAQLTVISGLAHANLGVGLASAAGLLALADKASLATAFLSFSCGLSGELLALKHSDSQDGTKSE
ncbi:hypothetical protein COO60DRAFT_241500 [Scenedesmus sp. NREL 46B-D3]|nr:hypothetical protein COO60DRAFT_241500 [Scenedesmus sp. NREL 46B-D3]